MTTRAAGIPVTLARLRTRDDVYLDGVFAEATRRSETALVWVHGLGSVFSSGQPLMRELSAGLTRAGVGYFKFNTRGHDVVSGRGRAMAGAAFERFRDCVPDLRAAIAFARRRGYRRIVLAGHSSGANKALFYMANTADRRVAGLILLGPVSDIAAEVTRIGRRELERRVAHAARLAARDRRALVPGAWGFWSARRYVSLYRPGESEDVFPYGRPRARWTALRAIRVPLAVMIGGRDEFLDRSPEALVEAFAAQASRAGSFAGRIIPGALHGFQPREAAVARAIVDWIRERVR
jgi:alpha-beta hydrolase superfamily lysophospholipase